MKNNVYTGRDILWKPANAKGIILQGHSYMDGMSWFADREEPEEPQTSRVRITVVSSDDTADVTACNGANSEMISRQRINTLIFFIG